MASQRAASGCAPPPDRDRSSDPQAKQPGKIIPNKAAVHSVEGKLRVPNRARRYVVHEQRRLGSELQRSAGCVWPTGPGIACEAKWPTVVRRLRGDLRIVLSEPERPQVLRPSTVAAVPIVPRTVLQIRFTPHKQQVTSRYSSN
jgi:hypothetical protein